MHVIEHLYSGNEEATLALSLPYEHRCKSRLRVKLSDGSEAGLFLPRGHVLRGEQKLITQTGVVIVVKASPEAIHEIKSDALSLARAAYHLGNRHVPVELGHGYLRYAADHVLAEMVQGLGLHVTKLDAPFEPEAGAYARGHHSSDGHTHSHGHGPDSNAPRIHEFVSR